MSNAQDTSQAILQTIEEQTQDSQAGAELCQAHVKLWLVKLS
jgi:hypothetical protein